MIWSVGIIVEVPSGEYIVIGVINDWIVAKSHCCKLKGCKLKKTWTVFDVSYC